MYFCKRSIEDIDTKYLNCELVGNLSKLCSYSSVLVRFSKESNHIDLMSKIEASNNLTDILISSLNKFLLHYKSLNNKYYIPILTVNYIMRFYFNEVLDTGLIKHRVVHRHYKEPIPFTKILNQESDKKLRATLQKSKEIDFYTRMKI